MLIEYFNEHRSLELIVAGDGRDRQKLKARANANIRFVGWQTDRELATLYRTARALIFPSEDDFGITPVEAMACGLPIIAYRAGGALDTIIEGETGLFFPEVTPSSLGLAMAKFEDAHWDSAVIANSVARRYGGNRFKGDICRLLSSLTA
jgi:glycosyltransferase involved in cell wall biosynthesis